MTQYEYAYASIIKTVSTQENEVNYTTYIEFIKPKGITCRSIVEENVDPLEVLNNWGQSCWKAQHIPSGIPLKDGLFFSAEYLLSREIEDNEGGLEPC